MATHRYSNGSISVPERLISAFDVSGKGSSYCKLALRGRRKLMAVVSARTHKAIGYTTKGSTLATQVLRQCDHVTLDGPRRRRRRRR